MITVCAVPICERPAAKRGYCEAHYMRRVRTGDAGTSPVAPSAIKTQEQRFWAKVDKRGPDECWPWTGCLTSTGYGALRPAGQRTGAVVKAHRYSAELAGMDIEGRHVLHSCDNPVCVNPAHLRPGTDADNVADMLQRGREGTSKLTATEVHAIRELRRRGVHGKVLAARFGVGPRTIYAAATGVTWRHLDAVTPPAARDLVHAVVESLGGVA